MIDSVFAETVAVSATPLIVACFAVAGMLTLLQRPATERELDRTIIVGAVLAVAGPLVATLAKWLSGWNYASPGPDGTWSGAGRNSQAAWLHEMVVTAGVLAMVLCAITALGVAINRRYQQAKRDLPRTDAPAGAAPWAASAPASPGRV